MEAIARALGVGGMDDLAYEHRSVLQVEHFARLAPILDMGGAGGRPAGRGRERGG